MGKTRLPTYFGVTNPERYTCHDGFSAQPSEKMEASVSAVTMGVDLAKNLFSVCSMNTLGRVMDRQDLRREKFAVWLAQLPAVL